MNKILILIGLIIFTYVVIFEISREIRDTTHNRNKKVINDYLDILKSKEAHQARLLMIEYEKTNMSEVARMKKVCKLIAELRINNILNTK